MLGSPRFRTFVLIAVPCVVFIYLLQRNSEYGASQVLDSFHHYTQKFKDLGAVQAVQQHAHKLSESLPWNTKPSSDHDDQIQDMTDLYLEHPEEPTAPFDEYTDDITEPYIDYTEDAASPFADYSEETTDPYADYTEDPTKPYSHYVEDTSAEYTDDDDSTEPYFHYKGESTDTNDHYTEHSTEDHVHYAGEGVKSGAHNGDNFHHTGDTKESYFDYTEDSTPPPSKYPTSSSNHAGGNSGAGSIALNLPSLQHLCRTTQWIEGLWVQCTSYCGPSQAAWCGGLNNGRTRLQTCLRLAIDAGAGAILPQLSLRGVGEAGVTIAGHDACADDWFDFAYLEKMMAANCPQLQMRAICPDALDRTVALAPPPQSDAGLIRTEHHIDNMFTTGKFREDIVLPALRNADRISASSAEAIDGTAIVEYGDTFIGWNYNKSGEYHTVRKELYKTIKFQDSMQQIGERIRDCPQLQHGAYIAVHLRGESDWPPEWGTSDQQMAMYMDEMAKIRATDEGRDVAAVFASSGEEAVIQAFRDRLQPLNYTVYDKWTLLADSPHDLANVEQADFDAMGIVDDAVLKGAMYFMGVCNLTSPCYLSSRLASCC